MYVGKVPIEEKDVKEGIPVLGKDGEHYTCIDALNTQVVVRELWVRT